MRTTAPDTEGLYQQMHQMLTVWISVMLCLKITDSYKNNLKHAAISPHTAESHVGSGHSLIQRPFEQVMCVCVFWSVCLVGFMKEDESGSVVTGGVGWNIWQQDQGHMLLCSPC